MTASDPPEQQSYYGGRPSAYGGGPSSRENRADPPSGGDSVAAGSVASSAAAVSGNSVGGHGGGGRAAGQSFHLPAVPPPSKFRVEAEYPYGNDVPSVTSIPSTNAVAPVSVLRNGKNGGRANVAGGGEGYDTDASGRSQRSSTSEHSQRPRHSRRDAANYLRYDDEAEELMSTVSAPTTPAFTENRFVDQILGVGVDAVSALDSFLPQKRRGRFALAVSALVGMVGVTFSTYHPLVGGASASVASRALKDLKEDLDGGGSVMDGGLEMGLTPHSDFLDDFDQRRRRAADLPDGTVFSEPAHTRMCRAIVERLDSYDVGVTNFEQVVFTESEYVCRDPDAPYTAVLNMFAAQLLHVANNDIGLNVDYTHRCAKWERYCTGNMTTIQFHLPDPLSINAYAFQPNCMDPPNLRSICEGCLASDDPTNPDCVLFPDGYLDATTNTCDLSCQFSQVLPWIRNNLRTVATNWLNTVESRALTFWLRNAAEFSHREKDDMEVSVVSLSCGNDDCDMSMGSCVCEFNPLPNWVYAMHIPRSSTNVAIVVSPTCAKFGEGCTLHAQELYHFFKQLYPRADITENVITSTSSWYMRMITADHLVCPPGVGCLLPSIARDAYTYVYETTSPTVGTWLTCSPQDYLNRLTIPSFPPAFVEGDCRHLRARIGEWTSDLTLAGDLQYTNAVDGYLGCADTNFVATAEDPYRLPTTYRWDETVWATCPVTVKSKDDFCTLMDRLSLTRILFVGDHTTMSQAVSLLSIFGNNADVSLDPAVVPNFSVSVFCTGHPNFSINYIRNDRLEEPGTTPSPGSPNCGPDGDHYCYPWSSDYSNYADNQLLIVNTGYHWGEDWQGYITNFQNFVGRIDEIAAANALRASDVLMFRTSIPGHKECDLHNGVYRHYGEYCPRIVNGAFWHWWGELPPYNDYAIRIINEWNLLNTVKSGANIELLDPWFMTVLRPDGHLSGSDAGESCAMTPQECMLYSLPGPVDWWNHLLLMQLADIATHLENGNPMQAWR